MFTRTLNVSTKGFKCAKNKNKCVNKGKHARKSFFGGIRINIYFLHYKHIFEFTNVRRSITYNIMSQFCFITYRTQNRRSLPDNSLLKKIVH